MARYWIGDSGNWNDTAHWSTSTGGGGGETVPTSTVDVYFDALSGTGTMTADGDDRCKNLITTNSTLLTFATSSPTALWVYGNILLGTGQTWNVGFALHATDTGHTVTTSGNILRNGFSCDGAGGEWTLQDNLNIEAGSIFFDKGTFNTNNKTITQTITPDTGWDLEVGHYGTGIVNFGSSTITCGQFFYYSGTLNTGTSTINVTNRNGYFDGGDKIYYIVNITGSVQDTSSDYTNLDGDNTFNTLTIGANMEVDFEDNSTQTVTNLTLRGSAGNNIVLMSNTNGTQFTLNATNPSIAFVNVKDCIAAGNIDFVDWYGTDSGNNDNWVFQYNSGSGFSKLSDPHLKSVTNPAPKLQSVMTSKSEDKVIVDSAPKLEKIIS